MQFPGLKHFADDVAAADKLAFDVELRDRRPVCIGLDAVAQAWIDEDVDVLIVDAEPAEDLRDLV